MWLLGIGVDWSPASRGERSLTVPQTINKEGEKKNNT